MNFFALMIFLLAIPAASFGEAPNKPAWDLQETGVKASLRGLCVVADSVVWVSGTGGTVLRTTNGGKRWNNVSVEGAHKLDFRDIHAFDDNNAVVLSAGQPARVYQTLDGGESWSQRYEHPNKKSFFDALSFFDKQHGLAMSDPIAGRVLLVESKDKGKTWAELPIEGRPKTNRGEAGFAASGTNMCVMSDSVYIALGGAEPKQAEPTSRILYSKDRAKTWTAVDVPMARGPSSGIFSIAFADNKNGVAVGGDYKKESSTNATSP